jgi:hypothetical protein
MHTQELRDLSVTVLLEINVPVYCKQAISSLTSKPLMMAPIELNNARHILSSNYKVFDFCMLHLMVFIYFIVASSID